jgi:hypothetical protein
VSPAWNNFISVLTMVVPLAATLVIAAAQIPSSSRQMLRWVCPVGFIHGFILWALFCWSEWREGYGLAAFAGAILACAWVGLMYAAIYAVFGWLQFKMLGKSG